MIAAIEPHDSQERFEGLGVTVLRAYARFCARDQVQAGDVRVRARRFVIATGSEPSVPPIPGLADVPYFTNETIFDNRTALGHLLIIGGGPIGCELAQAHRRLGAEVTVVDIGPVLPKDDPELARIVRDRLVAEGVAIHDRVRVEAVASAGNGVALTIEEGGQTRTIEGSHLLVAAGRTPRVDGLGLETAGVAYGKGGIEVDRRLRTSNRRIFAIGDVVGGPQFTHVGELSRRHRDPQRPVPAAGQGRLPGPALGHLHRPRARPCRPGEAGAHESGEAIDVLRWAFQDNDRARTERRTEGLIKVVTGRRGRILGASIVGAHAGELILPWVLAIRQKLEDRRDGRADRALSDARRGQQASGRQLLRAQAVRPEDPLAGPPAGAAGMRCQVAESDLQPAGMVKATPLWKRLAPLGVLLLAVALVFAFDLHGYLNFETLRQHREELKEFVGRQAVLAPLLFMAIYAAVVALSVPGGALLTIAGGFLFGTLPATLYVVVAATLGATILFLIAKTALGDPLRARAGPWLRRMEAGFAENALSYLLVLRLIPIFPFWLVNLVPAFLGVGLGTYMFGTFFGIIPGSFVYASVGNGLGAVFDAGETPDLGIIFEPAILIPIVGLAALALVPVAHRKFKARSRR